MQSCIYSAKIEKTKQKLFQFTINVKEELLKKKTISTTFDAFIQIYKWFQYFEERNHYRVIF